MSDPEDFDHEEFPLEPPKKDWPRARGKECVMVAEDSESLRDLMLAMLSGLGYDVLTAAGGHDAVRQIERHHGVDLVITDAIMPRGGGFQIMDDVQAKWPQTPILITSGYTEEIEAGLRERLDQREGVGAASELDEIETEDPRGGTKSGAPAGGDDRLEGGTHPEALVEFLPKPFTPEQLARLVRDILDRSKGLVPPRGRE
ncbi:MAG: response regulator [Candidatus Eisenbacteria bacterium]